MGWCFCRHQREFFHLWFEKISSKIVVAYYDWSIRLHKLPWRYKLDRNSLIFHHPSDIPLRQWSDKMISPQSRTHKRYIWVDLSILIWIQSHILIYQNSYYQRAFIAWPQTFIIALIMLGSATRMFLLSWCRAAKAPCSLYRAVRNFKSGRCSLIASYFHTE